MWLQQDIDPAHFLDDSFRATSLVSHKVNKMRYDIDLGIRISPYNNNIYQNFQNSSKYLVLKLTLRKSEYTASNVTYRHFSCRKVNLEIATREFLFTSQPLFMHVLHIDATKF